MEFATLTSKEERSERMQHVAKPQGGGKEKLAACVLAVKDAESQRDRDRFPQERPRESKRERERDSEPWTMKI